MEYRVELSPRAFADLDEIVTYISADSPGNAARWRDRLFVKLETLAHTPRSRPLAEEDDHARIEVRQTLFGRYRVLYTVRDQQALVYVLTVRHGARLFMTGEDVDSIE